MYVPPRSRESRVPVLQQAVENIRLGTLVTFSGGELRATHLPMSIDARRGPNGTLVGHVARSNPQWRDAEDGVPGIASFLGPNFYVSPSWYPTKRETGKVVPTWNYIAVEARGRVRFFHERDRLHAIVDRLTRLQEATREAPWSVDDAPEAYVDAMLGAIVGFELAVESLEGAWKLGQHKPEADRAGVADAIATGSDDPALVSLVPLLRGEP
jgi:transcriptional regulator